MKNISQSGTIYLGDNDAVGVLTGLPLLAGESISIDSTSALFAVTESGISRLAFLESYN